MPQDLHNTKEKITKFFKKYKKLDFEKGQTIIYPAENNLGCFYLESGFVREYHIGKNAEELTLHLFVPGSYFPMVWILGDIKQNYYYDALSDVVIYKAPKDKTLEFINQNPDVLMELTKRLLSGIDGLSLRIEQLAFATAKQRVANMLIFMNKHFGVGDNNSSKIAIKLTHQEIAAFAALNRETATREINKMKKAEIIDIKSKFITIKNLEKLKKIVG